MAEELTGVEDTLYIPLAGRVWVSQRYPEYFYDRKALEFKDNSKVIALIKNADEYKMMASASRYYVVDRIVRKFIEKYDKCNVVNLGAGLETMNDRIDSRNITFYELDMPAVIDLRRSVLGISDNEILIDGDITDISWIEQVDTSLPTLFVASGVFQYFNEESVLSTIKMLKDRFPSSELVFDATNSTGMRYAQRYVRKSGNDSAVMYFFVDDEHAFAKRSGTNLLESRGFYDEALDTLGKRLRLFTRISMKFADKRNMTKIIHLSL